MKTLPLTAACAALLVVIAAVAGWVMNLFAAIGALTTAAAVWSPLLISRLVGIVVAPLGAVLGWY